MSKNKSLQLTREFFEHQQHEAAKWQDQNQWQERTVGDATTQERDSEVKSLNTSEVVQATLDLNNDDQHAAASVQEHAVPTLDLNRDDQHADGERTDRSDNSSGSKSHCKREGDSIRWTKCDKKRSAEAADEQQHEHSSKKRVVDQLQLHEVITEHSLDGSESESESSGGAVALAVARTSEVDAARWHEVETAICLEQRAEEAWWNDVGAQIPASQSEVSRGKRDTEASQCTGS
jgi:hypothetical protein